MHGGLIFDLDGTLVDSLPGIAASLNRALERSGFSSHVHADIRRFIGNGSYELARKALPTDAGESGILAVESAFKEDYALTWPEGTAPYPGIPELLASLSGHRIAILSNKPHPFTVEIVARIFPGILFDPVLGQGPELRRKPFPDAALWIASRWGSAPEDCAFIGDSTVDLATAQAAGMQPLITSWGYHDTDALQSAGARRIFPKVSELATYLTTR